MANPPEFCARCAPELYSALDDLSALERAGTCEKHPTWPSWRLATVPQLTKNSWITIAETYGGVENYIREWRVRVARVLDRTMGVMQDWPPALGQEFAPLAAWLSQIENSSASKPPVLQARRRPDPFQRRTGWSPPGPPPPPKPKVPEVQERKVRMVDLDL